MKTMKLVILKRKQIEASANGMRHVVDNIDSEKHEAERHEN